jgi:hypothetical protein
MKRHEEESLERKFIHDSDQYSIFLMTLSLVIRRPMIERSVNKLQMNERLRKPRTLQTGQLV